MKCFNLLTKKLIQKSPQKPGINCKDDEFFCFDHKYCINATQHCDGYYDCKDFSDEQNCIG